MKVKNLLLTITGVGVIIIIGLYIFQANYFKQHFLANSTANGVEIGQMTVKEAEAALAKQSAKENFELIENGQVWKKIPKKELGVEYDYSKSLNTILTKQKNFLWITSFFKPNKHKLQDSSINEENLTAFSQTLTNDLTELNKDRTPSANATIKKSDTGFAIVPEVQGDDIQADKVVAGLKEALTSGKDNLDLATYVSKPTIMADNADLKKNLAEVSKVVDQESQYVISGQTIAIPKEEISSWIDYDQKNNKVALDKEKIRTYVASLGAKYNTSTNPTTFKSTARGDVSVPAGSYSWTIQTNDETEALYAAILAGEGVNRSPIIAGSASVGTPLIGNTYVEVDLQNQHMYFYKEGALVLDTDIVTGKPTTPTPPGINYVWNKERNATLRGSNDDGSKYAEPVDYWMPIDWTGVGLHDSNWQPAYGGQLWQTVGSHGCVNTPPALAKKLFDSVDVGTPVLVF